MHRRPEPNPAIAMSDREQTEHMAATWIARRDTGPWTDADAAALAAWLEESAGHRAAYYRLNSAWQETARLKAMVGRTPASKVSSSLPGRLRHLPLAIAATVLVAVGAQFTLAPFGSPHRNDYATVVGGLQSIPMADGSKVTLNTDSAIQVAVTDKERRIELKQGEAFFEVARDPHRPFVVSVANQRIVAVGTAFSVRRRGNDVRVIVAEGQVRIEIPGKETELREPLPAGSVVRTENSEVLVQTQPTAEIEKNLSWRSGLLTFRDTPLAEAVAEFNRYNTRKVVIEDPAISVIEIGGIFRATNLDTFVHLLEDGFPIRAAAQDDRIVLTAR